MKRKILAIGIISMLLFMGAASFSTVAKEITVTKEPTEKDDSGEILGEDFSVRVRGGFGVHVRVRSKSGETRIGEYTVIFDNNDDRKDWERSGSFTCGPANMGRLDFTYFQFGGTRVSVRVSIGTETVTKNGFCRLGFCFII
jgi:hypothetical protein